MPFRSYKKASKDTNWGSNLPVGTNPCLDQVQFGTILRIADALEIMSKNYQELIDERDKYKRWYNETVETRERLYARISGLRGYITRLKNELYGKE